MADVRNPERPARNLERLAPPLPVPALVAALSALALAGVLFAVYGLAQGLLFMIALALGVALYRTGRDEEALAEFVKAAELGGGDVHGLLFSSMACWKLGRRDDARRWYGKAVQWLEESGNEDPDLNRLRTEAEELLGVKKGGR